MKNSKRFLAMMTAGFLAITPIAATAMTAVAATITVNKVTGDTVAHTYKAYPIITGTLAADGETLTSMTWNAGIDLSKLETALKAFDSTRFAAFKGSGTVTTPDQFATMLEGMTAAQKEELAKVFNTSGVITGAGTELSLNAAGTAYEATSLSDGWYLIKDETSPITGTVRSANILEVKGNTAITPKYSLPTLDKQIVSPNPNSTYDANTASIGDTITYTINLKVPDTRGYNKYFYVVTDTLSPGLTYAGTTSVTIDGNTIELDNTPASSERGKYNIDVSEYSTSTGTTIKYVFEDFLGYVENTPDVAVGDDIVITYTATLNDKAVITDAGNPNKATLAYSNDPNHDYAGTPATTPDEPASGEPTGETPEDEVKTYTSAIKITKVDQANRPLKGATFTLTGDSVKTVLVSGSSFVEDDTEAAAYWKLKNGSYTTVDPTGVVNASDIYDSTTQKYKKVESTPTSQTKTSSVNVSATVDDSGILTFTGLGAGTYTLTETPPDGYNPISPIVITIGNSPSPSTSAPNWTVASGESSYVSLSGNTYNVTITNSKGSTLPTTGGIGTKLFYIIGGLLVTGSVVLLVTKKRMKANEE